MSKNFEDAYREEGVQRDRSQDRCQYRNYQSR